MTDTTLLPCPMCGSEDIRAMPMSMVNDDADDTRWWVGCVNALDHDADAFGPTKEAAIAAWNSRDQWRTDVLNAPRDGYFLASGYYHGSDNLCWDKVRWSDSIGGYVDDEGYPFTVMSYILITPPAPVSGGK